MLKDFKAFVLRGNVVDLAVAVVVGAAFGAVVASFVKNLLTPLVSIPGKHSFANLKVTVRGSEFSYGVFLNDLISFWNVTRFAPLRQEPTGEILAGKMIPGKGNVDNSEVVWTLHSAGEEWTVLKFDALLRPGLPAPQSLIDSTLRESAVHTVESVRDQLQGSSGIQPYKG